MGKTASCGDGDGAGACRWERRERRRPGAGAQGVEKKHDVTAAGTEDFRLVREMQHYLARPQELAHPGIAFPGRRAEPAVVPHPGKPARQDVLQKAVQELIRIPPHLRGCLGKLEAAAAAHQRNAPAKVRSTSHPTACMMESTMNQPVPVAVRHARHSEEPGAGIPHAGICEGDAGQPAFLPQSACLTRSLLS